MRPAIALPSKGAPLTVIRPLVRSLVILLVVAGAAGCVHETAEGLPPGTAIEDLPESESWGASLRVTDAGSPRLTLSAPYLAKYNRPDSAFVFLGPAPEGAAPADSSIGRVSVELFGGEGEQAAMITSQRAWYYETDGRLVAEGSVVADLGANGGSRVTGARLTTSSGGAFVATGGVTVDLKGQTQARVTARSVSGSAGGGRYVAEGGVRVAAGGGRTLEAGRVVWDASAGQFRAPGSFSFVGPNERVRGVGLTANSDLSRYSFSGARGEIEVRE